MTSTLGASTSPAAQVPETLGQLLLCAERAHGRKELLRWRFGNAGAWETMPAWRFYRHVIRVAIFLRDRVRIAPADRVVVACSLRPERIIAEWAIVTIGAVASYWDDETGSRSGTPKVAIVEPGRLAVEGARSEATIVIGRATGGARSWDEVLDLGGTLDTAERAQTFRTGAEKVPSEAPAIEFTTAQGPVVWTHGDMARRLRRFTAEFSPRHGDLAYVAGLGRPLSTPVPVWAFVADARTSIVLGAPGSEAEEIAEVQPNVLVGPQGLRAWAVPRRTSLLRHALRRVPVIGSSLVRPDAGESRLRDVVTFDGVRVA